MTTWKELAEFFVLGEPVGQPRPRASTFAGGKPRIYDPGTARAWKDAVILAAKANRVPRGITSPLRLSVCFDLPRPQKLMKSPAAAAERIPHASKPDIDNLLKAVMDALGEYGVWHDDRQVAVVYCEKWIRAIAGRTGANLIIDELGGADE